MLLHQGFGAGCWVGKSGKHAPLTPTTVDGRPVPGQMWPSDHRGLARRLTTQILNCNAL